MKLEQEFAEILTFTEIEGCYEQCVDCVKISEKFAIDFAEWMDKNVNGKTYTDYKKGIITIKELLALFKSQELL